MWNSQPCESEKLVLFKNYTDIMCTSSALKLKKNTAINEVQNTRKRMTAQKHHPLI